VTHSYTLTQRFKYTRGQGRTHTHRHTHTRHTTTPKPKDTHTDARARTRTHTHPALKWNSRSFEAFGHTNRGSGGPFFFRQRARFTSPTHQDVGSRWSRS